MKSPTKYEINSQDEFDSEILKNGITPSIVVFGADWSGNSQFLVGVIEGVLKNWTEDLNFYHIDMEKNEEIGNTMRIRSIPTTLVFHQGEVLDYFTGVLSKRQMTTRLEKVFSK